MNKIKIVGAIFAILGAITVILGAFGAHALAEKLDPEQLATYKTGVYYQFIHVLGGLFIVVLAQIFQKPTLLISAYLFMGGIVLFSGSLYLFSTKEILNISNFTSVLGPITPIGGLLFILGWIILSLKLLR